MRLRGDACGVSAGCIACAVGPQWVLLNAPEDARGAGARRCGLDW